MQIIKNLDISSMGRMYIKYACLFLLFTYLFMLDTNKIVIVLVFLLFTIPIHLYCEAVYKKEKTRFEEFTLYLNYIVLNYKISGKVRKALLDTRGVFSKDSEMYKCILQAIACIDEDCDLEVALKTIERSYYNSYIAQIHQYMVMGETTVGTAVYTALSQVNVKAWKLNVELLQNNKQKIRKYNFRYAIVALTTAYLPLPFLSDFFESIKSDDMYQIGTLIFFILFICVFAYIPFILVNKWIDEKE